MGRLFEEEFCVLSALTEKPARPCVFLLGGAKIGDAFLMMSRVLPQGIADRVLTGGLVGQVLLRAEGRDIGEASRAFIRKEGYEGLTETGRELLEKYRDRILLPRDVGVLEQGERREYPLGAIPSGALILDIGGETAGEYQGIIRAAGTVFVNGPMGVFEDPLTGLGTEIVWDSLGDTAAYTVVGGGNSITATKKYGKTGDINYICTGGGAMIRFLTGEELPVVKALRHGSRITR
jgi:phosphoglycerate kinase